MQFFKDFLLFSPRVTSVCWPGAYFITASATNSSALASLYVFPVNLTTCAATEKSLDRPRSSALFFSISDKDCPITANLFDRVSIQVDHSIKDVEKFIDTHCWAASLALNEVSDTTCQVFTREHIKLSGL